jgi:O-antigen ligase
MQEIAAHNSLLQVGAEIGIPAFMLYILIFFVSYRTLGKVGKTARSFALNTEIEKYASMFQVAFVGFFVSGFFVNAAFLDISWHLVGLTIALRQIANKEAKEKRMYEDGANAA